MDAQHVFLLFSCGRLQSCGWQLCVAPETSWSFCVLFAAWWYATVLKWLQFITAHNPYCLILDRVLSAAWEHDCWTESKRQERTVTDENFCTNKKEKSDCNFIVQNFLFSLFCSPEETKAMASQQWVPAILSHLPFFFLLSVFPSVCLFVFLFTPASVQKRKSSSLLDARMAKIYRGQRHSQEGDESASDDDDEGQLLFLSSWKNFLLEGKKKIKKASQVFW